VGERVGARLALLNPVECVVDIDALDDATTPAATAADRCQPARQCTYTRLSSLSTRDGRDRLVELAAGRLPKSTRLIRFSSIPAARYPVSTVSARPAVLAVVHEVQDAFYSEPRIIATSLSSTG